MAKHEVACMDCGRMFDVEAVGGTYVQKSHRYICPACTLARQANAAAAEQKRLRKGLFWKCLIGVIFLIVAFTGNPGTTSRSAFILSGVLIGGGLIAWGLIPWLKYRRREDGEE